MSVTAAATPTDVDVYCLHCGYNLRGLSGDPRRCPECGHFNPMGDVAIPAALISAQLKEMETAPAMCLLCVLIGLASLGGIVWDGLLTPTNRSIGAPLLVLCAGALFVCGLIWFIYCLSFRKSCLGKVGWSNALLRYHLFGVLTVLVTFGPLFTVITVGVRLAFSPSGLSLGVIQTLIGAVLFIAFVWGELVAICWSYAQARLEMEPLQREVAVTLARDVLRKKLFRSKRR